MNPYIIQSSLYLSTIYEAIIAKQEILRAKMQQYNDVKLYLFSFILPEYSSNEYIDNNYRGTGIGKKLVTYAINHLQVTKVDVNEQNIQAVGFYKYIGFNVYKRSDLDGEGKEYPILHMQL